MAKRNKMLRKILVTMCSAVLLVGATVGVTVAYLTSQTDVVTNTFSVGNVKITLDEAPVDLNGVVIDGVRRTENEYKLMPGHTYAKDPTVHVDAASENCWLFVKVENGIADIEAATTIADQMTANGWTLVDGETNVYSYKDIVAAGGNVNVFSTFKIDGAVKNEALAGYADDKITIQAYAVQVDGFTSAKAAWDAAPLAAWKTTTP